MTTILIVDDSLTVRMDLTRAFEAAGLDAIARDTLAGARGVLERHPVALVVLDLGLPDGDGTELLRWMRDEPRFAELPVLVLASENEENEAADRGRKPRTGATDYLGRPYDAEHVVARARELARPAGEPRLRVLVIDDSPTVRAELSGALAASGYDVITAADGAEGLRIAARERPGAIIVDGFMPSMDGATVIRRVRLDPALRTIPCLLLTGSGRAVAEVDAFEAGADAFVRKDEELAVILARVAAMVRNAQQVPEVVAAAEATNRILAIDDDELFLELLTDLLQMNGYEVVVSTSGDRAIELLSSQPVDCILLDWHLDGVTGLDLCQQIKTSSTFRNTPLIVLTGSTHPRATLDALTAGADDFVSKTVGGDILTARIRTQIRRRRIEEDQRRIREQLLRSAHDAEEERARRLAAEERARLADQLEQANERLVRVNQGLETFTYSVSHDLRAPLRTIQRFATAVVEDAGDRLDEHSRDYLARVVRSAEQLSEMIEALLELSRLDRAPLEREQVDLSSISRTLLADLSQREPDRQVEVRVQSGVTARVDHRLVRSVLDNLLANAWKFTAERRPARIEVGSEQRDGATVYFVRDNGAGFDSTGAPQLFQPFQRLHREARFAGHGIGLATVRRIVERHGGEIWAESAVDAGASFYFTLPD
ncbi:MAG: response regulator [Kofleriaceae bacterium]